MRSLVLQEPFRAIFYAPFYAALARGDYAAEGIDVRGPFSADSLYHSAENGSCDAVVGMYHDQGVIPLKKYGYVTVIAGTPILRTTAGHGTAYDIAGQGIADASVMTRAVLLAADLAARRAAARAA